jgi:hypothetical protein
LFPDKQLTGSFGWSRRGSGVVMSFNRRAQIRLMQISTSQAGSAF